MGSARQRQISDEETTQDEPVEEETAASRALTACANAAKKGTNPFLKALMYVAIAYMLFLVIKGCSDKEKEDQAAAQFTPPAIEVIPPIRTNSTTSNDSRSIARQPVIYAFTGGDPGKSCAAQGYTFCDVTNYCVGGDWVEANDINFCCSSSCTARIQAPLAGGMTVERFGEQFVVWYGEWYPLVGTLNYVGTDLVSQDTYEFILPNGGSTRFRLTENTESGIAVVALE